MPAKPVLAFDCATSAATVALWVEGVTHRHAIAPGRQSAELVAAIDGLMRAQGVAYEALGAIVTTDGPGSFTGLRVGLAALHGLALASGAPVKTIGTLEAVAWAVPENIADFHVAMHAGKGEAYTQHFERRDGAPQVLGPITLLPLEKAEKLETCFGNLTPTDHPHWIAAPDAGLLCAIAAHLPTLPLAQALPRYVRPPDARLPAALTVP